MLSKIDVKKQISISLIFFVMSMALFSVGLYAFLQHPFEWPVFINYGIVSIIISAYLFFIMNRRFNFAFILFVSGYVFAFAIYLYNATKDYSGFLEIAGILSWFVIMGLVIALGLTFEFLLNSRKQNKELQALAKEQQILQQEREGQIDVIDVDYDVKEENEENENTEN